MALKSEAFPCGCSLEWDGKNVKVTICDWHKSETRKLRVGVGNRSDSRS